MSNLYRSISPRHHTQPSSRFGGVLKVVILVALAVGVFMLAVRWFRGDDVATANDELRTTNDAALDESSQFAVRSSQLLLTSVEGETGSATATRSHEYGAYTLSIVATLPAVDTATTAYEAWYVTPGITDFFSLGELYAREDGAWGLVWSQTDALVRYDIADFSRVIIIREPRDGNAAPSADHVVDGTFE